VLTGGDYWLLLLNAVVSPSGNPIFWDQNSGPSAAWENTLGDLSQAGENNNCSGPCTASETFQILTTDVPEPSSTALMLVGLIAMVATSRRWTGATAGMRGGRTFLSSASGSPPSAP
jgi:hypothetical protein